MIFWYFSIWKDPDFLMLPFEPEASIFRPPHTSVNQKTQPLWYSFSVFGTNYTFTSNGRGLMLHMRLLRIWDSPASNLGPSGSGDLPLLLLGQLTCSTPFELKYQLFYCVIFSALNINALNWTKSRVIFLVFFKVSLIEKGPVFNFHLYNPTSWLNIFSFWVTNEQIAIEKKELKEENSALDTQVEKLQSNVEERVHCRSASTVGPVFVMPVHGGPDNAEAVSKLQTKVNRPQARYASSLDSWPSHILSEQSQ